MKNHKSIKIIIWIFIGIALLFPMVLKIIYGVLSYAEWYSILASFWGGAIWGITTLIALYISTDETRRIQEENNTIQIKNDKKIFTDEIATLVSKYITDITAYFYAQSLRENENIPSANRIVSVEIFYLLHIKLDRIDKAKELLEKLDQIHNNYCFPSGTNNADVISEQTNLMKELTIEFIRTYREP